MAPPQTPEEAQRREYERQAGQAWLDSYPPGGVAEGGWTRNAQGQLESNYQREQQKFLDNWMKQNPYSPPQYGGTQPRPNVNDQYAPPRREPAILIDGRTQRGPAPDQQQNPFAGMQPGVYSPTGQFFDGNLAQGLSQAQRQRDAFVMQMNQATLPYQMANVFGADLGAPNYDFQGMLGRANKMVEDGFYNPFTQYFDQDLAEMMSQYAPPSMYQTDRGPRGGIYT